MINFEHKITNLLPHPGGSAVKVMGVLISQGLRRGVSLIRKNAKGAVKCPLHSNTFTKSIIRTTFIRFGYFGYPFEIILFHF